MNVGELAEEVVEEVGDLDVLYAAMLVNDGGNIRVMVFYDDSEINAPNVERLLALMVALKEATFRG